MQLKVKPRHVDTKKVEVSVYIMDKGVHRNGLEVPVYEKRLIFLGTNTPVCDMCM